MTLVALAFAGNFAGNCAEIFGSESSDGGCGDDRLEEMMAMSSGNRAGMDKVVKTSIPLAVVQMY